ncbi:beta-ketoacyl-ACP synthase II [Duganella sp. FT94W]|uniref:Nodulation protein E n=1 Tax=Duganella lactea TaxID=2692173 RepID=A0ABW9V6E4_9BURK|nr:beta-ketoacyl-[acyl-carrier-protein] synthase family protein [Duganella lactea]MYM35239.1 beta-ketoacyl-ACP synthase II [Duganella lactea]
MSGRRVVITGLGAISALGVGAQTNFQRALAGHSGIGMLTLPGAYQRAGLPAAQIHYPLPPSIKPSEQALFDRNALLGWIAASEALAQSGLQLDDAQQACDSGVFWGTGMGGASTVEAGYVDLFVDGKNRVRPLSVVAAMNNAAAAQIALRAQFKGTVNNYSSACVSSAQAIGEAFRHIQHGYAERVLAGGAEALLTYGVVSAWDALRVLAPADPAQAERSCRPFAADRSGLVLGEAAAAVMLESLESAQRRGAVVLAELVGYGASNDATHITKPDPDGQSRAMAMALRQAGLAGAGIDYLNAHGAGTLAGDQAETDSIRQTFGAAAERLMVSSTKSMHGHTLGAAGALELVLTTQTLATGSVPPTAFLVQPDPACDLDYVPLHARHGQRIEAAMSNSFAFGGSNVSLIVRQFTA